MPRNGSGVYSLPPGSSFTPNTLIQSAVVNAINNDLATDLNVPRPIVAGGTGGSSGQSAMDSLFVTPVSITDENILFQDPNDKTKKARFDVVNVAAGTTRFVSIPNADVIISAFLATASGFLAQTTGASAFAALGATFTSSSPGQFTAPNGLRLKWGVHSGGDGSVTFATAFLSGLFAAFACPIVAPGGTSLVSASIASSSASGMFIYKRQQNGGTTSTLSTDTWWLAIGS